MALGDKIEIRCTTQHKFNFTMPAIADIGTMILLADGVHVFDGKQWRNLGMAELDRPRSFIERYIIERATHFRVGFEKEDAWQAALDGKAVYEHVGALSKTVREPQPDATQAGNAVGAMAPSGGTFMGKPISKGMQPILDHAVKIGDQSMIDRCMRAIGVK